jgi:hypothetical protein
MWAHGLQSPVNIWQTFEFVKSSCHLQPSQAVGLAQAELPFFPDRISIFSDPLSSSISSWAVDLLQHRSDPYHSQIGLVFADRSSQVPFFRSVQIRSPLRFIISIGFNRPRSLSHPRRSLVPIDLSFNQVSITFPDWYRPFSSTLRDLHFFQLDPTIGTKLFFF